MTAQTGHLRIIGGSHRGRRIAISPGSDARPTGDRVREALFNILGERVLGLPGDVRVDKDVAWVDVPRN